MAAKRRSKVLELRHIIQTRVNDETYQKLNTIIANNPQLGMSRLLRDVLNNKKITVFTKDQTLDNLMEELARLRTEIRAIGVNINQITRYFNTYPEPFQKATYAKMAFKEYVALQPKIDELFNIITKLGKKWLSE
jgi:hypothetical protein